MTKLEKAVELAIELAEDIKSGEITIQNVWDEIKDDPILIEGFTYFWAANGYFNLVKSLCYEKYREIFERLYNM